jgi:5-methyltetrahydrofolate--homocysteine methyltransferase
MVVKEAVIKRDKDHIIEFVQSALDEGINASDIIDYALIAAMDIIGEQFSRAEIFVPEMLMAAHTMKAGLEIVKPLIKGGADDSKGEVVLATVKGDVHDIGKNIVGMMLESGGFTVFDMGVNVPESEIVRTIEARKPVILGLSALLTTTMPQMKRVIEELDNASLRDRVKVIVGGAPVNQKWADDIGANGYAPDAGAAVTLSKSLVEN